MGCARPGAVPALPRAPSPGAAVPTPLQNSSLGMALDPGWACAAAPPPGHRSPQFLPPRGRLESTQTGQTLRQHLHRAQQPHAGLGTPSSAFSGIHAFAQDTRGQKVTQSPLGFRKWSGF